VFSPDFALPDFFLFDALKGQLAGRPFGSANELVEEICETTKAIPRAKHETVFLEWEESLHRCIDINSAYVD
jgi:hypothetical protein